MVSERELAMRGGHKEREFLMRISCEVSSSFQELRKQLVACLTW
jgi:hypothetical protein